MLRFSPLLAVLLVLGSCTPAEPPMRVDTPEGAVILSGASVYLGDGRTLDDALVVLDGDRIAAVSPRPHIGFSIPPSARLIDLTGKTILPGLIDLHAHLGADGCFEGSMSEGRLRRELRADLASGVTTVLDLGSTPWLSSERARGLAEGWDAPELLLAGPIITVPGGHPAAAEGRFATMAERVTTREQARLAVGRIADDGADVIKAALEPGGFGGLPKHPTLTQEELAAVAEEAHARGLRLFVHVTSVESARRALDAGADVLAHVPVEGSFAGTDLPRRLAEAGVPVVSTLSAFEGYYRLLDDPGYLESPAVVAAVDADVLDACRTAETVGFAAGSFTDYLRGGFDRASKNVAALRTAGASIALGTDAGSLDVFHGPGVHRELALLVAAGLSPGEAIDAATTRAADALGRTDIGAIRPGLRADFLIANGNPATRIEDISKIEIVVRAGRFYDKDDLANL